MWHDLVQRGLELAQTNGWTNISVVSPVPLPDTALEQLLASPCVFHASIAGVTNPTDRLSAFKVGQMIPAKGPIILLASDALISKALMKSALKSRHIGIYCLNGSNFRHVPFYEFAAWRIGDKLINQLNNSGSQHWYYRLASWIYSQPRLRDFVKRVLRRPVFVQSAVRQPAPDAATTAASEATLNVQQQLAQLLAEAVQKAPQNDHVAGRVVLINAGLGAGGAERQVVNTLLGLHQRGIDVRFLGEYLFGHPDLAFFQPLLTEAGVPTRQIERRFSLTNGDLAAVSPILVAMHLLLPSHLIEEIANLVLEFRDIKPEVVHAWQDSTSIKAAIAALIVGVPRILVSSRNMTPPNFAYHAEYMQPAYQALAQVADLVFINNSEAGAQDYCRWLNLPRGRFTVVRNGINFNNLKRASLAEQQAFRNKYNIPPEAPLMGSVFRLWAEKRPLMWVDTAALLAESLPDHHFVLAGDGPMRDELHKHVASFAASIRDRIHLIEPQKGVSALMSSLDVFFMTSSFEGTPNVALEAQWCGAPAVVTKAGGSAEAVFSGQTGLVTGAATAAELAAAVLKVQSDRLYKARTMKFAQDLLTARFGFDRMIEETLRCYGWDIHTSIKTESPEVLSA